MNSKSIPTSKNKNCSDSNPTSNGQSERSLEGQPFQKLAYNRHEASAMLSISPATLDRLVLGGLLKPSRALRKPLFAISELERFLRETTASID